MRELVRRRVFAPIGRTVWGLLLQGIGPRQIAAGIAIGLVVGVFPVLGTTTVLCTVIAVPLRLNLVAIHAVHYAATPLQLLLIIPFVRLGEHLAGAAPEPLTISESLALLDRGVGTAISVLWDAIVHAVIGWVLIAPIALAAVYLTSVFLLQRANAAQLKRSTATAASTGEAPR